MLHLQSSPPRDLEETRFGGNRLWVKTVLGSHFGVGEFTEGKAIHLGSPSGSLALQLLRVSRGFPN